MLSTFYLNLVIQATFVSLTHGMFGTLYCSSASCTVGEFGNVQCVAVVGADTKLCLVLRDQCVSADRELYWDYNK